MPAGLVLSQFLKNAFKRYYYLFLCMTEHHMSVKELTRGCDLPCMVLGAQHGSSVRTASALNLPADSADSRIVSEFACFLSLYFPEAVLCLPHSSCV